MPNPFDKMAERVFDQVSDTFGYLGAWGNEERDVLFREPTTEEQLAFASSDLPAAMMEYRFGHFSGLYESVRNGNSESVTIEGAEYFVKAVHPIHDGRTYRAHLDLQAAQE